MIMVCMLGGLLCLILGLIVGLIRESWITGILSGLIPFLLTMWIGFGIASKVTGDGEVTGIIYATSREGLIWQTNTVWLKTDVESSTSMTFAVPDATLYEKAKALRDKKVTLKCYYTAGYIPSIGRTSVATAIEQF